jgi:chromosomal replication initiation ATPase DnaA
LSAELAVEAITAWLDPLRAVTVQERTLILNVPDGFEITWISNQYIDAINRTLSKLNSTVCQAQIVTSGLV